MLLRTCCSDDDELDPEADEDEDLEDGEAELDSDAESEQEEERPIKTKQGLAAKKGEPFVNLLRISVCKDTSMVYQSYPPR